MDEEYNFEDLYEHNAVNPTDPTGELDEFLAEVEDDPAADIQEIVQRSLDRALDHYHEHKEPKQTKATDYYHGRPFGDEEEGRSQAVVTEVRDVTLAQLPSLMRIFCGADNAVEFRPRGPEDAALAEQMTDYVRYVIHEDNPGFLTLYAAFKDALVRDMGIVKWWYDEDHRVESARYTGLGEMELQVLMTEASIEDIQVTGVSVSDDGRELYDVELTRVVPDGRVRIAAVPNEEFIWTPSAPSLEQAPLVAHVREVPVEEIRLLGVDEDLIEEVQGEHRNFASESLRDARHQHNGEDPFSDRISADLDPSQRPIQYAEAYCLIDGDGDGVAELRLFQCVGPNWLIVNGDGFGEIVDELPFAVFCPDPEPHTVGGLGNYDLVGDLQRIKSQVLRATLNSLAAAVEPQQEVVEGEVNMADLLNPEINKIVRVTRPGMVREIKHEFVGGATLPVMEYLDEIKEARTGHQAGAGGLDADVLQSTTKAGVAGVLAASQQRIELIARIFAETGMKDLFRGVLRLLARHQNHSRVIRLRGEYVTVDPRHWDVTMDVVVNVGLGAGTTEEKTSILQMVLQKQEEYLANGVPLVTFAELRYTLGRLLQLAGERSADKFFRPWGAEEQAQYEQMQAQQAEQQEQDPAALLVQVEMQKVQLEQMIQQAKLELERWKLQLEDDRERDKIARDSVLKEREIEAKHLIDIADHELKAQIEADRAAQTALEGPHPPTPAPAPPSPPEGSQGPPGGMMPNG